MSLQGGDIFPFLCRTKEVRFRLGRPAELVGGLEQGTFVSDVDAVGTGWVCG